MDKAPKRQETKNLCHFLGIDQEQVLAVIINCKL